MERFFSEIYDTSVIKYVNEETGELSEDLKKARNIDRALWVYGHIFYKKK